MSYPPAPNPYASPAPVQMAIVPTGGGPTSMDYMRSFNYIFENPDWITTILLLGLVYLGALIPGVGIILNLLFIGYQFEVMDLLLKTQGRQYPGFDFGRIGDYLGRGVWPFLVSLVATFVLVPLIYGGIIVGVL